MRRRTAALAALLIAVVSAPPAQGAWSPQSATEPQISWGDPVTWPPSYAEHFLHDGEPHFRIKHVRTWHQRRDIRIAQGLGVAFTIDQQVESPWHAEATEYWNW